MQDAQLIAGAYRSMLARRTANELAQLARIKRLLELIVGDAEVRGSALRSRESAGIDPDLQRHAESLGLDAAALRPLWDCGVTVAESDTPRWPLVALWRSWTDELAHHRQRLRALGSTREANALFDEWRSRQIVRLSTELPPANSDAQIYAVAAFELSDGCSVGCSFCGLSAGRLHGIFSYRESRELWNEILGATVRLFGSGAATLGCYWATEPFDNPDYLNFIEDAFNATGVRPPTTTAAALRDVHVTRRCIERAAECGSGHPRFSVLSTRQLRAIHAAFTPDELLNVPMVIHAKGAPTVRARAGRMFDPAAPIGEHATIAGVIGLLVSMVKRTVRLIVPCLPSTEWPDGFRVLGTAPFDNATQFEAECRRLIDAHCRTQLDPAAQLSFRSDLKYHQLGSGFRLEGAGGSVTFNIRQLAPKLGELLTGGKLSFTQIVEQMNSAGAEPLALSLLLSQLRRHELLEAHRPVSHVEESLR